MVEERYIDMMQAEIDGLLSEEDARELRRYLDTHGEANQYYEELRGSVRALSSLPQVDPPPSLKSDIMRAIRRAQPQRRSVRDRIREIFESRVAFNYVYALSAGIVIGVALYGMIAGLDKGGPSSSDVSGSLVLTPPAAAYQRVDEQPIDTLGITGMIRTRSFEKSHIAECVLQSGEQVRGVIEFEPRALCLAGFSQTEGTPEEIGVEQNRIVLTSTGSNSYLFLFESRLDSTAAQVLRVTLTTPRGMVQRTVQLYRLP